MKARALTVGAALVTSLVVAASAAAQHGHGAPARRSNAEMFDHMISPDGCAPGTYYNLAMSMCVAKPKQAGAGWVMPMLNTFFVFTAQQGPRGETTVASPSVFMMNAGVDTSSWHRVELDLMLTAERWTFPARGYPLLLQIGERDERNRPYLDAQHPHSSPLMGATLANVFSFSATKTRLLRLSFAPRGYSTDGPIPFMHRPSALLNPDAPLGHHLGQDVGHITSTVFAASLWFDDTIVELSAFHGQEPEPTSLGVPLGTPNSFALRVSQRVARFLMASASFASVGDPEGHHDEPNRVARQYRVSASLYTSHSLWGRWRAHTAFVYGGISDYEGASFAHSLLGEATLLDADNALFFRGEALQRTAAQLAVESASPASPLWVGAVTAGYARRLVSVGPLDLSLGASVSLSFVPEELRAAYGGYTLFTGRLFLELRGMHLYAFGGSAAHH